MCVMEDTDFQISSDCEGTEVVKNVTIENNVTEIEDDRIPCSNNGSLNKILELTISKATNVALSNKVEDSKFVARFTEVFCDIVHANVCVGGLPWTISCDSLTSRELEQQKQESDDARLSKLSKEVERVASKRKTVPRECARIRERKLKHERQNLRKQKIEALDSTSTVLTLPELVSHEELAQICNDLNLANKKMQRAADQLPTLEKNFEMAQDILKRQKVQLEDTLDT